MQCQLSARVEDAVASSLPANLGWGIVVLGLVVWQGWATLGLFGPDHPWRRLLDDEPIVSGRHPLHLYHGYLGVRSWLLAGTSCCFDPAFQAGYPKTPVFDGGCRPAEVFLALAGGSYQPAAYKVGLAISCTLLPLFLVVAAWGAGLRPGAACLAATAGTLIWWSRPCRELLEAGDLHLLLAALAALVHVGLLVRFDRAPSGLVWIALVAVNCLGWFTQPLMFAAVIPFNLLYYLSVGTAHRHLAWHLALLAALSTGLAVNAFWLVAWLTNLWIRSPLPVGLPVVTHTTLQTLWQADLWGTPADRILAMVLLGGSLVGAVIFNCTRQRAAARLFGVASVGFVALAVAGIASEPLGRHGTAKLLVPALWFATVPAAYALTQTAGGLRRLVFRPVTWAPARLLAPLVIGGLLVGGLTLVHRDRSTPPLEIGLGPERQALVDLLTKHTTPEARVLLEEFPGQNPICCWTALLPLLTDRAYLGGLDPRADIDYAYASWDTEDLCGRPLREWSTADLEDFCQRYNVGWVVCWSPAAVARFRSWSAGVVATECVAPDPSAGPTAGPGCLFTLQRPRSYILKGKARWIHADAERIVLADLVPDDGKVVLSLHYQRGLQASPSRVLVDREPELFDPIPFIRLRVPGPVSRVTLTWGER
jgi:hypothetical protein